jgi:hypothetical protein
LRRCNIFWRRKLQKRQKRLDDARDGHTIIELSGKRLVDHASMVGIVAPLKGKQIENVFVVL